ncbi:DMT family transporter [Achromobacter kerstersii]|jgi:multidrug transporter EmrE-like cation transporter|uniref:DMT family transporter n=1 Tax=Achromobacter kerstersii TaxID=1353890 RepID=UPI00313CE079
MKWLILAAGILANSSASVLLKMAMVPPRQFPSFLNLQAALSNWPFWFGLCLYGVAFFLYAAALARLPLNIAHPVLTSGAIASVTAASLILFGEPFHWTTGAGILMIIAGVVLLTAHSS